MSNDSELEATLRRVRPIGDSFPGVLAPRRNSPSLQEDRRRVCAGTGPDPAADFPLPRGFVQPCVAQGGLARPPEWTYSCGTAPESDRTSPPRRVAGGKLARRASSGIAPSCEGR